jgi:hypothetical protein
MTHRIHIAPTHGQAHFIGQFFNFRDFDFHGVNALTN